MEEYYFDRFKNATGELIAIVNSMESDYIENVQKQLLNEHYIIIEICMGVFDGKTIILARINPSSIKYKGE